MSARILWIVFWLIAATIAAMVLAIELRYPPQRPVTEAFTPPSPEEIPPLEPFQLPPEAHYQTIAARPLFIQDRRPEKPLEKEEAPKPKPEPEPEPEPEQEIELIGVVMISGRASVLLRVTEPAPPEPSKRPRRPRRSKPPKPPKPPRVISVHQGETMDNGWQLQSVAANRVVLRKNGKTKEIALVRPPAAVPTLPKDAARKAAAGSQKTNAAQKATTGSKKADATQKTVTSAKKPDPNKPPSKRESPKKPFY